MLTIDLINKRSDSPLSMRIVDKYNAIKTVDEGGVSPREEQADELNQ